MLPWEADVNTITVPVSYDKFILADSLEDIYDINVRFEIENPTTHHEMGILLEDFREIAIGLLSFSVNMPPVQ
jgi:hypothetical protein